MLGIAALVLAADGATLRNGFVWDDVHTVVHNPAMTGVPELWAALRVDDWAGYGLAPRGLYRPLATISLWIDARVWGLRPIGFHATALLLHTLTALALGALLRFRSLSPALAWGAAGAFAVHPLVTETVDWISARPDLLCGALSMSALALASSGAALRSAEITAASCFAKETGLATSSATLFYLAACGVRRSRVALVVIAFGAALYLLARSSAAVPTSTAVTALLTSHGSCEALARWGNAFSAFVRAIVWPLPLDATRRIPAIGPGLTGGVLASACVCAGVAWSWRRGDPLVGALVIGAAGPLAMAAVYGVTLSERYLYVPVACTVGLTAVAVAAVASTVATPLVRAVAGIGLAVVLFSCVAASHARAVDWSDGLALFSTAVEADPHNPEAWSLLGAEWYKRGDRTGARRAFERAVALGGASGALWSNLCAVRREAGDLDDARIACDRAVQADPWNPRARLHRGQYFIAIGDRDAARREFVEALRIQPLYAPARKALSVIDDPGPGHSR